MLRDDHSDYNWFFPTSSTTVDNSSLAITEQWAAFGVPQSLISDILDHFKNETIRMISIALQVPHGLALSYRSGTFRHFLPLMLPKMDVRHSPH